MPDTITTPGDALARLRDRYLETGADLALAVFPAAEPERLGPVLLDGDRVTEVLDKPARPPAANTWGAAIWSDAFADLLHDGLAGRPDDSAEPVIGHFFDLAVRQGLKVIGVPFPGGSFEDAGTRVGILRCLDAQAEPALVPDRPGHELESRR
jgi:glucose-1-phosphate thymidylyltransferase